MFCFGADDVAAVTCVVVTVVDTFVVVAVTFCC